MPINLNNVQITGGLTFIPEILTPSGDPYWANVSLLMNNTTTNNQTNNSFIDSSTNNYSITRAGTPTQGSFTPYTIAPNTSYSTSVNGGSGYFDGSGDLLSITNASNIAVGTSPFTLEGWCYFTNVNTPSGGFGSCASFTDATGARGVSLFLTGSGSWRFRVGRSVAGQFEDFFGTTTLVANRWYHFKIVRTSTGTNDTRVFLNGVQEAIGTSTISINMQQFSVGRYLPNDSATTDLLQGYVSDIRLTNNAQPSTVPTSPLTAVSGTQVLFNFTNGGIFDGTAKNNLTTLGDAKVSTAQAKFGTTSVAFDGTGDYLFRPSSDLFGFGLSDFTIECWVRTTVKNTVIFDNRAASNIIPGVFFIQATTGRIGYFDNTVGSLSGSTTDVANGQWNFLAWSRSGGTFRMFVNGLQEYSGSVTGNFGSTRPCYIGASNALSSFFDGHMQDLRITKGVARYTANFTPPTQPFPTY